MTSTPAIALTRRSRRSSRVVLLALAAMALAWLSWAGWRAVAAGLDTGWSTPVTLEGIQARPWLALVILASLAGLGIRYGLPEWRRVSNRAGIVRVETTDKGIELVGTEGRVAVKRGQTVRLQLDAPIRTWARTSDTVKVTSGSSSVTFDVGTVARAVTAKPLVEVASAAGVTVKADGVSVTED